MKNYFITFIQLTCFFWVSSANSQDVNPFNGSLNYGAPLLSVPSDRGNAIPLGISYGGNGIGVSQQASEVGLGWNMYGGGSIVRQVNGIPDDFNALMFNQRNMTFDTVRGVLSSKGPSSYDILSSRRNMDSTEFFYPNYDSYSIHGPGIGGKMAPLLLSYMSFSLSPDGDQVYDPASSSPWKRPNFIIYGDFADTLVSRHYPSSPVDNSTPFKMPYDVIPGDYHNDATPYFGKKGNGSGPGENYNQVSNRVGSSNFVEYTMNSYGISSFSVTNTAGFVYTYGLPVYSNNSINFSYPLNNDYTIPKYTISYLHDIKTSHLNNYFLEHTYPSNAGTYVTEVKESNKVPIEWKLTSITGPDYIEVGNNGFDESDKGYWVVFEYKKWCANFNYRYPAFGFNYLFGNDQSTSNYPIIDPHKRSGKLATATLKDEELYYLNSIKTSSHKAIFVRDIRDDEVSSNSKYDGILNDSILISPSGTVTALNGHIFDEGGPMGGYVSCVSYTSNVATTNYEKTIEFGSINTLVLKFHLMDLNKCQPGLFRFDNLHIYAGNSSSAPELSFTYGSTTYTSPFNSSPYNTAPVVPLGVEITIPNYTATAITFKIEKYCHGASQFLEDGFHVEWHAVTNKRTPQLSIKRILLFENSVAASSTFTNSPNAIASSNQDFDLSNTIASSSPPYNETWYQANKSYLDANMLKGVLLEHDYSLANKYHRNINVKESRTNRLYSPSMVQANLSINTVTVGTGKLTLNKIVPYEFGGIQVFPSITFDYNKASITDNPNFDPRKTDYWGYYKSDASSLGFYGYTTTVSKDSTDAWMLRKIISPMGGIAEIEYESNRYSKVLKGNGGFTGSSRIFPIQKIINNAIYLEEGSNMNEDLTAVYNSTASGVYSADLFVPTIMSSGSSPDPLDPNSQIYNIFGPFTYNYNSGSPLPLIPIINGSLTDATIGDPVFKNCSSTGSGFDLSLVDDATFYYTGNGWVRFTFPVNSYTTFGGGTRVKKLTYKTGNIDSYSTLYEYEGGVALNEADRFTHPVSRYASHSSCAVPEKLAQFGLDRFDPSPMVGYSKVKIKNLGQINEAKGWIESDFITSDEVGMFGQVHGNFQVNISGKQTFTHNRISPFTNIGYPNYINCSRVDTGMVVEYVEKFGPFWGLQKEQKVFDVNSNMIRKETYEYESTQQGALVENFVFGTDTKVYTGHHPSMPIFLPGNPDPIWISPCSIFEGSNANYQACIMRTFPAILKKTTSFGLGSKTVTQTLKRDELTGEGTIIHITGDNNSSALTVKVPAFRIPTYSTMGAKSIDSSFSNVLGQEAYYYSVIDSTLTGSSGSPSTNFAGASSNVYTQNMLVRGYNSSTNTYTNTLRALPYWFQKASYNWVGDVGSIDPYGLYKKSELSSHPFNFVTPSSSSSKWRIANEVSLKDERGNSIETLSFNNKFSATKLDFNGKYILAQISNCNFQSFTYSGFEYTGVSGTTDGEINMPAGVCSITSSITAHTGSNVAAVTASGIGPNFSVAYNGIGANGEELGLMRDRIYRASAWTHTSSVVGSRISILLDGTIAGVPATQTVSMAVTDAKAVTIGEWKLLYVDLKVPANYISTGSLINKLIAYLDVQGGGTGYFDDFQFHPIESEVSAKVYDQSTGRISAEINSEGYATKYFYDAAGRIISVYQEIPGVGLKRIKTNSYNFGRGIN